MKMLLDFLPIILFFATFKYAESNKDWAAAFASDHLGFIVSGGVVGVAEAPVLLSTVVVIVATLLQIVYLKARGHKIDTMLWVSLALVTVLGGATIYFHNENFIKWKPTGLYWVMGAAFLFSQLIFRKNLLQSLMGSQLQLPTPVWNKLNIAWVVFFAVMGALNLYVAFNYSTDAWVNFKLFGGMGLMVVFTVAQGLYISKHVLPDEPASPSADPLRKPL